MYGLDLVCQDKRGVLAQVSTLIANAGFSIESVEIRRRVGEWLVGIRFVIGGAASTEALLARLSEQEIIVEILAVAARGKQ